MEEIKNFIDNKKNLINLLILGILVLAVPLIIGLVRQTQTIKSRALVPEVQFGGTNVRTVSGRQIVTLDSTGRAVVDLTFTSPFDNQTGSPIPSVSPGASASPRASGSPSPSPSGSPRASPSPSPSPSASASPSPSAAPGGITYRYIVQQQACGSSVTSGQSGPVPASGIVDNLPGSLVSGINYICAQFISPSGVASPVFTRRVVYNLTSSPSPSAAPSATPAPSPSPSPTPAAGGPTEYRLFTNPLNPDSSILSQGTYTGDGMVTGPVYLSGSPGAVLIVYAQFKVSGVWEPSNVIRSPSVRIGIPSGGATPTPTPTPAPSPSPAGGTPTPSPLSGGTCVINGPVPANLTVGQSGDFSIQNPTFTCSSNPTGNGSCWWLIGRVDCNFITDSGCPFPTSSNYSTSTSFTPTTAGLHEATFTHTISGANTLNPITISCNRNFTVQP